MNDLKGACVRLSAAGLFSVCVAGFAAASLPIVTSLTPHGVQRGKETVVQFKGSRLQDAYKILCDQPGLEILEVKAVNNGLVEVRLRAEADLTPGLYPVRLITRSGIANLRLIGVGSMPVVKEVEPNNAFDAPQVIELNQTIEGVVKREDVDHFRVKLAAGQTITVEIEGIRLGFTLRNQNILDPYIAILNEGRFEVASSDDSSLLQQDGFCTFTAKEAGDYT
ncbi:MAG: serine protease, partial [Planctomycetota bacterium]